MGRVDQALQWAHMGVRVFPLHPITEGMCGCGDPTCSRAGKHPRVKRWQDLATVDESQIRSWWRQCPNAGIAGYAGKTADGAALLILDVDGDRGEESLGNAQREHGELPVTFTTKTPRGRHLWFFVEDGIGAPAPMPTRCFPDLGMDIRAQGGFVVLPPSEHRSGEKYQVIESCEIQTLETDHWLPQIATSGRRVAAGDVGRVGQIEIDPLDGADLAEVWEVLSYISPDVGYADWINVCFGLHERFCGIQQGLEVFIEWSSGAVEKHFSPEECRKHWESCFLDRENMVTWGTVIMMSREAMKGREPTEIKPRPDLMIPDSELTDQWQRVASCREISDDLIIRRQEEALSESSGPQRIAELADVDGLIGRVVRENLDRAVRPQAPAALAGALAAVATVFGRNIRNTTGLRGSLYQVIIAPSGAGKDFPLRYVSNLLLRMDLIRRIGPSDFASGSSVGAELRNSPNIYCPLDEFGDLLSKAIKAGSKIHYLRDLMKAVREVFSRNGSTWAGRAYGSSKADDELKRTPIESPCLNLLGATTPQQFWKSVESGLVEDGTLPRFLLMDCGEIVPRADVNRHSDDEPSMETVNAFRSAMTRMGELIGGDLWSLDAHDMRPADTVVRCTHDGIKALQQYSDLCDDRKEGRLENGEIWSRSMEIAWRIALLRSVSDWADGEDLAISEECAKWGCELAKIGAESLERGVRGGTSRTDYERLTQDILAKIRAARGYLTWREVSQKIRDCPVPQRDQIMDMLSESGDIIIEARKAKRKSGSQRKARRVIAVEHYEVPRQ